MTDHATTVRTRPFLLGYELPPLPFAPCDALPAVVEPVWTLVREGDVRRALRLVPQALEADLADADRAALYVAAAVAEYRTGGTKQAGVYAERSLELVPRQWAAQRVLAAVEMARRDDEAAYARLSRLFLAPEELPAWDTAVTHTDYQTALASCAWRLRRWDQVAIHLILAYPDGLPTMPARLKEDWFHLALYREIPDDAFDAAELLLDELPMHTLDEMLQALAQQGYREHALFLYRTAYASDAQELYRRRLVALHIKLGQLDEARRLAGTGALVLAA